jgi:multiple sugar transport system permease protein
MPKVQKLQREELRSAFFLLLPATIGLLVFSFYPIISAARTSFFDVSALSLKYEPVGFTNYIKAFQDKTFLISISNTLFYTVAVVFFQILVALIFALILKNAFIGVGFFRTAFFLPGVTSLVVVSTIWKIFYHTDVGILNSVIQSIGLAPVGWLTDANVALWSVVIIGVWKEVGFSMLVLLGGLNVIPSDYYEAAAIDGASGWTGFRKITLPLLRRSLLFVTVLATINAIKVFIPIYVITNGGPMNSTQTLVFNIYRTVFGYYKLGYGSALSMILLLIVGMVVGLQFRLLRSDVEY